MQQGKIAMSVLDLLIQEAVVHLSIYIFQRGYSGGCIICGISLIYCMQRYHLGQLFFNQ